MIIPSGIYIATKSMAKTQMLENNECKKGIFSRSSLYWIVTKLANVIINTKYMPCPFLKSSQRFLSQLLFITLKFPIRVEPFDLCNTSKFKFNGFTLLL